jgi:signal transduction histidine kinase
MSIKQRITISFTILVASMLVLFSVYIAQNYESYRKELIQSRLQRRALSTQFYFQNKAEFLRSSFLRLYDQHISIYDTLDRRIYSSSGPDDHPLKYDLLWAARQREVYFAYDSPRWDNPKEGMALTITQRGTRYVVVITAYDQDGWRMSSNLRFTLIVGNIISLLAIALVGFGFAQRSMRPFDKLIRQLNTADVNDFSFRLGEIAAGTEADYLARSFNQLLEKLGQLAASQENFVAYASHEIRTPLTVVKGILETSLAYDKTATEVRISTTNALYRLEGAIDLANALLQLAEVERMKPSQLHDDINVVDAILDTVTYFSEKYPQQSIELELTDEFTEQSSSIRLLGSATLLRTVFVNVIDNACKYSNFQPVTVKVRYGFNAVLIDVLDMGIGIPKTQLGDVFLPMMRAENVGSVHGFGLGLTLAKRIIDMHQGELSIMNKPLGGTSALISLPAVPL